MAALPANARPRILRKRRKADSPDEPRQQDENLVRKFSTLAVAFSLKAGATLTLLTISNAAILPTAVVAIAPVTADSHTAADAEAKVNTDFVARGDAKHFPHFLTTVV